MEKLSTNKISVSKLATNTKSSNLKQSSLSTTKKTVNNNSNNDMKNTFLKYINLAKMTTDYNDELKDIKVKAEKLEAINEMNKLVDDQKIFNNLFLPNLDLVIEMIMLNIFRPLPSNRSEGSLGMTDTGIEDNQRYSHPSWQYIKGIYDIFLSIILNNSIDVKTLKSYITVNFINEYIQLFDSSEEEEREYLKNILHKLYLKLVPRRKMIRKALTDCFQTLIHDIHRFNGASELLDILASIISGFAVPLREEHQVFFKNIIIPLHKVQTSNQYFPNLIRCSLLFITKDANMAFLLLEGLLKYWPFANASKESFFLQELNEVLEFCEIKLLKPFISKLFKRLVKCLSGSHVILGDAICLFESESFVHIIKTYKSIIFPILVPALISLTESHWHNVLKENFANLKEIIYKIDPSTYKSVIDSIELKKKDKNLKVNKHLEDRHIIELKWNSFSNQAKTKNHFFNENRVPFKDDVLLCEFNITYRNVYDKEKYLN